MVDGDLTKVNKILNMPYVTVLNWLSLSHEKQSLEKNGRGRNDS